MPAPKKRARARPVSKRKPSLVTLARDSVVLLLEGAPFHVSAIRKRAKELGLPAWSSEGQPAWSVDWEIVGDVEMARLNGIYREKPTTTDVLSFPAAGIFQKRGMLGSIVICSAQLKRQAKELGHGEADELHVLLAHGFCHLLDWDHERSPKDAREMAKVERAVLEACFPATAKRVRGLIERAESRPAPVRSGASRTRSGSSRGRNG